MYLGMTDDPAIDPNLAKEEVRQAIRYAIDYDGIIALTDGQAIRGPAVYPIGILGLSSQEVADGINPKHDVQKAKDLLAKAGLADGFTFKLDYGTGPSPVGTTYDSIAQKIQSDLKEVGITVELVPAEFNEMLTKYRAKTQAAVISYNQPDYLGPSDFTGQMILHTWAPRLHWENPELIAAARAADAEQDPAKRDKMYQDILTKLVEVGPYAMLVQGKTNVVVRPNVEGYEYLPLGTTRLFPVSKS
jgi:peptide/nickel transport system substrate-binding protein